MYTHAHKNWIQPTTKKQLNVRDELVKRWKKKLHDMMTELFRALNLRHLLTFEISIIKNLQNWRLTSSDYVHTWWPFFFCCFLCKTQRDAICRNQEPTDKTWDRYSTFYGRIFVNENSFKCIWFICYSFKQFNGVASWRGKKKVCVWIWFRMKISNITWILNESSNAKK